jgi:hypothetical protein
MPKLSKLDVRKYVANDGFHCPYCQGGDLTKEETLLGEVILDVVCHDCKRSWLEVYKLVSIKEKKQQ